MALLSRILKPRAPHPDAETGVRIEKSVAPMIFVRELTPQRPPGTHDGHNADRELEDEDLLELAGTGVEAAAARQRQHSDVVYFPVEGDQPE